MRNRMAPLTDHPEFSPLSLLAAAWKQKFCIITIWIVVVVISVVAAYRLPVVYKAEAVILVESQKIPEKYVSATVGADLQERLNRISQQILSSSQLLEIIKQFDLYQELRNARSEEELVQRMRADIGINMENRWGKDRPGAFRVSYQGPVPVTVAGVANRLGSLFIDENLHSREVQAMGTAEFLEEQLAQAKARLEEQEARLSDYKLKYNGELPQQESSLLATLSQLQVQLQGVQDAINHAEQNKLMLQNSVESAKVSLETLAQAQASAASDASLPGSKAAAPRPLTEIEQLRMELERLRLRYKENHPDVRRAKAELARVERLEQNQPVSTVPSRSSVGAARPARAAAGGTQMRESLIRERERVENLQSQVDVATKQLEGLQADRKRILQSIASCQSRISKLPIREQQLAGVSRDYEISKSSYQSLLDKKLASDLAANMEKQQKPERFTMLDPARVPEKPIKPDRPLLVTAGTTLGLLLGLIIGIGRQLSQNTILGEWELPAGVPVLGRVPLIAPGSEDDHPPDHDAVKRKKAAAGKWRLALVSSSLLLVLGTALAAGLYFGHWRGGAAFVQLLWRGNGQN
jgi:succinoglycan biosynthesis transport protein ExoP